MQLVYFIGNQGTGKTTQSENLVDNHGFKRVSFAQPIRRLGAYMLAKYSDSMGVEEIYNKFFVEPGYTRYKTAWIELDRLRMEGHRGLMEGIGEGARHEVDERIWVRAAHDKINVLRNKNPNLKLVTDDVRRPWEEQAMRNLGAFGVMLNKPGSDKPGIATEVCQQYFETGQFTPDVVVDFDLGQDANTEIIENHVVDLECMVTGGMKHLAKAISKPWVHYSKDGKGLLTANTNGRA